MIVIKYQPLKKWNSKISHSENSWISNFVCWLFLVSVMEFYYKKKQFLKKMYKLILYILYSIEKKNFPLNRDRDYIILVIQQPFVMHKWINTCNIDQLFFLIFSLSYYLYLVLFLRLIYVDGVDLTDSATHAVVVKFVYLSTSSDRHV